MKAMELGIHPAPDHFLRPGWCLGDQYTSGQVCPNNDYSFGHIKARFNSQAHRVSLESRSVGAQSQEQFRVGAAVAI